MKSVIVYTFVLCLVFGSSAFAETKDGSPSAQAEKTEPKKKVDSKKEEAKRAALRKVIEEKKVELNGTSWEIETKSSSGKGTLSGKDVLSFQDEKFRSQKAEKNGYTPTNYTLTVQEEGGPTIWETMQTGKEGEITFWRGEWKEGQMSGVISRQLKEGSEDYYFSSSSTKEIPEFTETEEKEPTAIQTESAAASTPVETAPAKELEKPKKKGWFA